MDVSHKSELPVGHSGDDDEETVKPKKIRKVKHKEPVPSDLDSKIGPEKEMLPTQETHDMPTNVNVTKLQVGDKIGKTEILFKFNAFLGIPRI